MLLRVAQYVKVGWVVGRVVVEEEEEEEVEGTNQRSTRHDVEMAVVVLGAAMVWRYTVWWWWWWWDGLSSCQRCCLFDTAWLARVGGLSFLSSQKASRRMKHCPTYIRFPKP